MAVSCADVRSSAPPAKSDKPVFILAVVVQSLIMIAYFRGTYNVRLIGVGLLEFTGRVS